MQYHLYLIEQQDKDGRWFIRGSERFEHDAIRQAQRYAIEDKAYTVVTDNHNNVVRYVACPKQWA